MKTDDTYIENLLNRLNNVLSEPGRGETACDEATSVEVAEDASEISQAILDAVSQMRTEESAAVGQANGSARPRTEPQPLAGDMEVSSSPSPGEFWPLAPADWAEMKLTTSAAEELALKCLM